MMQATKAGDWTIQDLEMLPEHEWFTYEIIEGELFVTRTPHYRHQQICTKIAAQLEFWSGTNQLGRVIIAPGILFSDSDNVIPDVVWVSQQRLEQIEDEAGHLTAAPELIVEVLSPGKQNERRDKQAKLQLYSVQGVQEYWIVDRFLQQVEVYRRQEARLVLVATLLSEDGVTSPLLPDFSCVVSRFFP